MLSIQVNVNERTVRMDWTRGEIADRYYSFARSIKLRLQMFWQCANKWMWWQMCHSKRNTYNCIFLATMAVVSLAIMANEIVVLMAKHRYIVMWLQITLLVSTFQLYKKDEKKKYQASSKSFPIPKSMKARAMPIENINLIRFRYYADLFDCKFSSLVSILKIETNKHITCCFFILF